MPGVKPLISLRDVYKIYPRSSAESVHALNGISLDVPAGAIHGIVGQSGAGKSTLIRCLTALEKPTSGQILVDGQDLAQLPESQLRKARRQIGMVFQSANLLDSRTAAGNIAYPLYLAGVARGERHERVEEMLELVGLADRGSSYPSQLSGGQRQRVGIARALADNPKVLLCDEPTSALDAASTAQVLHLIRDVRDRLGVTVVIITHEMAVVREICDSVTLLEGGAITQTGTLEEILRQPSSRLARDLIPPPAVDEASALSFSNTALVDIAFTSQPGEPTGSRVMGLAASLGADVVAGVFETVGTTQVARLALAVPGDRLDDALATLQAQGIDTEVRA
ncbi:ATP-binding cassette domain-containing protein [Nanchangia anserum]|uniref:ATP-binding cassette domain-containing protein n=1 Tax=Nanchangia anserum TaxID=2692125 RepID=A0A8I0GEP6_9ACTO|nr:methionine ABC transporter ATP-binding protein [Nanchangia anserum]MBD3689472.1 ATP-binding cassette domain-containing protein [Nanchangia anserum]QOX82655.1 ATP-binding cassette domain-containing protein [Nanchangia anserum]